MHQQLLGHLLGALDDEDQERVDAILDQDENCRQSVLDWRRRLAEIEALRPDYDPPRGLAERTCRFVAAYREASAAPSPRMTPLPAPPCQNSSLGWLDVTTVSVLLMTAIVMIIPAIDRSRFEARVASCQEGLRQFGLAMNQYADRQQVPLSHLAHRGQLTPAGIRAVGWVQDNYSTNVSPPVCPSAWLAAQGVPCNVASGGEWRIVLGDMQGIVPLSLQNNWPGAWRDGTTDDRPSPEPPVEVPLLADAPSADLPGQIPASHRGLGKNFFYSDGRVDFVPVSNTRDTIGVFFQER